MVWIEVSAANEVVMHAPRARIFQQVIDVCATGRLFPGIERIEDLGDGRYHWWLAPRRTLGSEFIGEYIAQYVNNGTDEMTWTTVSGNLTSSGRWKLTGFDGAISVSLRIDTALDAPVPRILKKPAELFAERDTSQGLLKQLERVKALVEVNAG